MCSACFNRAEQLRLRQEQLAMKRHVKMEPANELVVKPEGMQVDGTAEVKVESESDDDEVDIDELLDWRSKARIMTTF